MRVEFQYLISTFQLLNVDGLNILKSGYSINFEKYYLSDFMYKKLFNLMVLMISVLTLNLLTGFITDYIVHYKIDINPFKFTAIAMLTLVFILVPAYSYMSSRVEYLVARVLVSGSNSFGKTLGLLISFATIFGILFAIYIHQWFHINLLHELKTKLFHYLH
jgi:hypothetical protein